MAIPTTDQIAQNYAQTLQNNVGYGQRALNKMARQTPPGSDGAQRRTAAAPVVDGNSWGARGVQGFRGAGWQQSNVANVPQMDAETKMILEPFINDYVEGGKQMSGYRGDYDVRDKNQVGQLIDKQGYAYAKGPEDLDYVNAGLDLASIYGKPIYKKDGFDFTQKSEVDRLMQSLGFGHNLGSTVDLQANTELQGFADNFRKVKDVYSKVPSISDYLFGLGYKDFSGSQYKDYLPLVSGVGVAKTGNKIFSNANEAAFAFANQYDPVNEFNTRWANDPYSKITQRDDPNSPIYGLVGGGDGQSSEVTGYGQMWDWGGKSYGRESQAAAARDALYNRAQTDAAVRGELLAQMLTKGGISGQQQLQTVDNMNMDPLSLSRNFNLKDLIANSKQAAREPKDRSYYAGDEVANQLTADQLKRVLGSKDIMYGGNTLGTVFNAPYNQLNETWNDYKVNKSKNTFRERTRHLWDQGVSQSGLQFDNPEWLQANAKGVGSGFFVGKDSLGSMPGAKAVDNYEQNKGDESNYNLTKAGKVGKFALSMIPIAGAPLATAFGASQTHNLNKAEAVMSLVSMAAGAYGASGGGGGGADSGITSWLAEAIGEEGAKAVSEAWKGIGQYGQQAAIGAGTGALTAGLSGGSIKDVLKSGALGAASGAGGAYVGNTIGSALGNYAPDLNPTLVNALKSAGSSTARGALGNLAMGRPVASDLGLRAATGAISGLGNLFVPKGATKEERDRANQFTSQGAKTLASIYKSKNPTKPTRRT